MVFRLMQSTRQCAIAIACGCEKYVGYVILCFGYFFVWVKYVGSIFVLVICIFSKLWLSHNGVCISKLVRSCNIMFGPLCERDYLCEF